MDNLLKEARKQHEDVLKSFVQAVNQRIDSSQASFKYISPQPRIRKPAANGSSSIGSKKTHRSRKSNTSRASMGSRISSTSIDSSGGGSGQPMKTAREARSESRQQDGRDLKLWMQQNNIFNLDVFNSLVDAGFTSVDDFEVLKEKEFRRLRTQVRATTRKNNKDPKKLARVDKTLVKVEKEWRARSGKKKTMYVIYW